MLYLFDLDGTLITSYMDNADRDYHHWSILPHRVEVLAKLLVEGHQLGIVTNQAGVAFGHIQEREVTERLSRVFIALGLPQDTPVQASFGHAKSHKPAYRTPEMLLRRKPSGQMIREHMMHYPAAAAEGVLYVGDRPEDQAAAEDAGVAFQWEHDFFRPN